jgi:hypothetical protein
MPSDVSPSHRISAMDHPEGSGLLSIVPPPETPHHSTLALVPPDANEGAQSQFVLVDEENTLRPLRWGRNPAEVLPRISARALRLSLYRQIHESGMKRMSSIDASVEWARAMLIFSATNTVIKVGDTNKFMGYPRIISLERPMEERLFRVFGSERTLDTLIEGGRLFASSHGYVRGANGHAQHFADLTGIFLTTPEARRPDGVESYLDIRIPGTVQPLRIGEGQTYLIPGPPRITSDEIRRAHNSLMAGTQPDPDIADVFEIVRMFGIGVPEFSIPFDVQLSEDAQEKDLGTGAGARQSVAPPSTAAPAATIANAVNAVSKLSAAGASALHGMVFMPTLLV